jgi:hypothetical protein
MARSIHAFRAKFLAKRQLGRHARLFANLIIIRAAHRFQIEPRRKRSPPRPALSAAVALTGT